jgi:hypothetical protein
MIQQAVGSKDLSYIVHFTTAKEAWEGLFAIFVGNESMKRNKYNALRNQAEGFMKLPNEDHQEMYRRLLSIATAFGSVGAKHVDDMWIKDKYVDALMPYEPMHIKSLQGRYNYFQMSSNEVMQEMQAFKVAERNAQDSMNHAIGMAKGANLSLKAVVVEEVEGQEASRASWSMSYPEDLEYHYNDHMAIHARGFWVDPSKENEDNIKRNNSSGQAHDQDHTSSPNARLRIEKLVVEGLFPRTRPRRPRPPKRILSTRIRRTSPTRSHQELCY